MLSRMTHELSEVHKYKNVIYSFVFYLLRARYRRSFFGFLWTVLAPLSHYILLSVVFSFAMRINTANFITYLLSGLIIFNYISSVITKSTDTFLDNEHFIKKIYVPKTIFALNIVFYEGVNFIGSFIVLFLIGAVTGQIIFSLSLFSVLIPLFFSLFLLTGLGLLVGISSVYVRDLKEIVPSLMLIIFYLTPIIYPESVMPDDVMFYMDYNIFYYFVKAFREPFVSGAMLPFENYILIGVSSLSVFFLGLLALLKFGNKIVFKL